MRGIVGSVDPNLAEIVVVHGLGYRGCDAAGLAVLAARPLETRRRLGTIVACTDGSGPVAIERSLERRPRLEVAGHRFQ